MKIIACALGAGLLVTAGLAASVEAQSPPGKSKDQTKVFAYKQTAPAPASAPTPAATSGAQLKSGDNLPNAVRFGSQRWWEDAQRASGGEGAQ